nr:hypothetical protein [Myxococcota bacterium]
EHLRGAVGGGPLASGVAAVELTVHTGPLAAGIEIVELSGGSRAGAQTDAVFLVQGDGVFAPVRGDEPLRVGGFAEMVEALPSLLADARALRLARRTRDQIKSAMTSLDDAIDRKEATFRARIERLERLRVVDPSRFALAQLARVREDIAASVNAVMEHAAVHLRSELALLQQGWIGAIAGAASAEAMKPVVAKLEADWHAEPRRIAEEVRVLVMGGLGGSARDLHPQLVAALVPHGLPDEHAGPLHAAPELEPTVLLPSLSKEPAKLEKPSWLTGLFRGFEAKRTELREKVHERLEHMREVADAELLDLEPRLHATISTALATLLGVALERQGTWLDQALDAERAAIEQEREAIAPLVRVRDAVRTDAHRLGELIQQLERHQPAVAVAAAAAETASLSR